MRKQGCPKMVYEEGILAVEGALDKEAGCDTQAWLIRELPAC